MNPILDESMVNGTVVADREDRAVRPSGPSIDHRHVDPPEPKRSVLRRLVKTLWLTVVVIGGVVFGLYKMRVDIPALHTPKLYAYLDDMGVRAEQIKGRIAGQYESRFGKHVEAEAHHEPHKILVTRPMAKDVTITQDYVCLIRSQRHIEVSAKDDGYLEAIGIKEGQSVKAGDVLFQVVPILYKAELAAEVAEWDLAKMEMTFTETLAAKQGVSQKEVSLYGAKLARAKAKMDLAKAKLDFAAVKAPFDGIVDRLKQQQGSLVKEGDILTTLSDNSVMWVYFNVTEKRYLEYMAETGPTKLNLDVELRLANHDKFPHMGKIDLAHDIGAIEANFDPETGNIAFRADFPNPDRLLRHGQTGTVLISRVLKNATVIPQRATFENLAKRYVYVVGEDHVVHQREIGIDHVLDDIFVIGRGLDLKDQIIFEGTRQVRDGEKVEFETRKPEEILKNQKDHAE